MRTKTAARAAIALQALDEWRAQRPFRSVYIRIGSGRAAEPLWHVELWSRSNDEPVGVGATSGELGPATTEAFKLAAEARLT